MCGARAEGVMGADDARSDPTTPGVAVIREESRAGRDRSPRPTRAPECMRAHGQQVAHTRRRRVLATRPSA